MAVGVSGTTLANWVGERARAVRRGVAFSVTTAVLGMLFDTIGATEAAASCIERPTMAEAIARADLVFVGTAVEVTNVSRWATFVVEDIWKGQLDADRAEIRGGPRGNVSSSNERRYAVDTRYLVFALAPPLDRELLAMYGEGVRWTDSDCSLTQPYTSSLAKARPGTARLVGAPQAPAGEASPVHDRGALNAGWVVLLAAAIVGLVGAASVRRRRRRHGSDDLRG
jgi:hypothetical protein